MTRYTVYGLAFSLVLLVSAAFNVDGQSVSTQGGKLFASPEDAANALIAAAETFDEPAFKEILGPGSYDIMHSGEPGYDRDIASEFAKLARAKKTLTADKRNRRLVILTIG